MGDAPRRVIETVAIVSTGSEILQGLYADTNAQWIAQQITALGLRPALIMAAPDDLPELLATVGHAAQRADLVISSGGLGPTEDDLNRDVFKAIWNVELEEDATALRLMQARFASRRREMPERNRVQALIPRGAEVLQNANGTAPGFFLPPTADKPALLALPGPPKELKPMFINQALPAMQPYLAGRRFSSLRVIHLFGQPESTVNEAVRDVFQWHRDVSVTILARPYGIDLRIAARTESADATSQLIAQTEEKIRTSVPADWIYGTDEDTMAGMVGHLLKKHALTVTTAESCTGGLVAKLLTDVPGSSAYLKESVITYSNAAKTARLGVSAELLEQHGAVSAECAAAMAEGAARVTGADIAVSVTGIAGPDKDGTDKPVGLTYIGLHAAGRTSVQEHRFYVDREMNRNLSALSALDAVRKYCLGLA